MIVCVCAGLARYNWTTSPANKSVNPGLEVRVLGLQIRLDIAGPLVWINSSGARKSERWDYRYVVTVVICVHIWI